MNNIPNIPASLNNSASIGAGYFAICVFSFIIIFIWLLDIIIKWKIIDKIDGKGWKALIPFYNDYTIWKNVWSAPIYIINLVLSIFVAFQSTYLTLNLSGSNDFAIPMFGLAGLVAVACAVICIFYLIYLFKLSQAFGHTSFFVIGLFLLPTIFEMILAFSNDKFVGKKSKKK